MLATTSPRPFSPIPLACVSTCAASGRLWDCRQGNWQGGSPRFPEEVGVAVEVEVEVEVEVAEAEAEAELAEAHI